MSNLSYSCVLRSPTFCGAILLAALTPYAPAQERNHGRPPGCDQYNNIQVTAADLPTPSDRQTLASCKSEDLYFGFDSPADPVQARKCAYIERENRTDANDEVFGAAGLLTMIYANGKGASRNFELALKFACEVEGAEAENNGRFDHLLKLKREHWTGEDFSLCDDATSGFLDGWCAHIQERFDQIRRQRSLARILEKWSLADRQGFAELQRSASKFFEVSSRNEVDLSGTSRGAFEIGAAASLNDNFLAALVSLESGQLPKFTTAEFGLADAKLNVVYAAIQSAQHDPTMAGTVTPEGIKLAQRAWLSYREAWVRFGSRRYPRVTGASWRTWLTRERIEMLQPNDAK
jgi:uncharacterized protein YecT (DUF1311 family)